ncbi:MAG: hypothetical protein V2I63_03720 [Pseudomonadales bacterium]|jgi:hypothetical protein|nr:hypothetical protein [Pseudomonadales bacterium]
MTADKTIALGTRVRSTAGESRWNHLRETVLMMELAVGQIEAAMKDSDSSVDALTRTFTDMAGSMGEIREQLAALPEDSQLDDLKASLLAHTDGLTGNVHQAIVAFQFYDRLAQRLAHVTESLDGLAQLVGDAQRVEQAEEWSALQDRIRERYSMPEEVEMFEAVLIHGLPVREALANFMNQVKESDSDDIEFF